MVYIKIQFETMYLGLVAGLLAVAFSRYNAERDQQNKQ